MKGKTKDRKKTLGKIRASLLFTLDLFYLTSLSYFEKMLAIGMIQKLC